MQDLIQLLKQISDDAQVIKECMEKIDISIFSIRNKMSEIEDKYRRIMLELLKDKDELI